ncbi:hypothetical protein CCHR01_16998 [Colletotrichum chrysophilum]|uniref:Uncharacterized protein n=1 Tax=Colletotrichum chrysophilum TaxID=1836956 RepID=A0AAD9E9Y5_9PEZI|nr:hypothetical protein CCHR01_16998 [Colletotrichum chrysophilum]
MRGGGERRCHAMPCHAHGRACFPTHVHVHAHAHAHTRPHTYLKWGAGIHPSTSRAVSLYLADIVSLFSRRYRHSIASSRLASSNLARPLPFALGPKPTRVETTSVVFSFCLSSRLVSPRSCLPNPAGRVPQRHSLFIVDLHLLVLDPASRQRKPTDDTLRCHLLATGCRRRRAVWLYTVYSLLEAFPPARQLMEP